MTVDLTNDQGDATLLASARAGDRDAMERLLAKHQERVYRFSLKMCGNPSDASDVLQDTLLALVRSMQDLRYESSLSTWLYAVARNFCNRKHRKGQFEPARLDSLGVGWRCVVDSLPRLTDVG